MSKKRLLLSFVFCISTLLVSAQQFKIHSHNDYHQNVPFWNAFANGLRSIEVDVFLKNDTLFATHAEREIKKNRTIENLYLQPIQRALTLQLGNPGALQLLVDIKSEPYSTLKKLISILKRYPNIINKREITIVISGNRPKVKEYINYPDFIQFDYQSLEDFGSDELWDKVALISLDFKKYSAWNGKGRLTEDDYKKVKTVIEKAHAFSKPFRFWGSPDSKTAWKAFTDLGIDYINTDFPYASSAYLKTLKQRVYFNNISSEVYRPSFESDQKNTAVKNVILLIGDGNGLTQISSAALANGGDLTLTQLKSIGFLKTQSADDFTTDSAAAGTALATGVKTNNRAIGVDPEGASLVNLTEVLSEKGYATGCITTDLISGATPAAFYAHRKDRSDNKGIISDFLESQLSLMVGGRPELLKNDGEIRGFTLLKDLNAIANSTEKKVCHFISSGEVPSVLEGRGNLLAEASKNGISFLNAKKEPFFLMIESAKIDSYGHENKVSGIVSEGIDFDNAISEALKFADVTGNTLVIVTADHETSGFSIPQGDLKNKMTEGDFTTHDHTGTMVPIFAYGPKSDEFQGVYENNEAFNKILSVLNIKVDGN